MDDTRTTIDTKTVVTAAAAIGVALMGVAIVRNGMSRLSSAMAAKAAQKSTPAAG
jgi:hypothetical protein